MTSFHSMGLPKALEYTLAQMQFTDPTPIQAQAIPFALEGKDILGSAQTGTGKTGAFGIPLVAHLINNPQSHALVMTPTRELATQVAKQLRTMVGKNDFLKSTLLIGGESMHKQIKQLKNQPRLIVGTPGRINDHLKSKSLHLAHVDFLVLDETDRMLDMGFSNQIENVVKFIPNTRQTLLFSATLPKNIVKIADTYLSDPMRVAVDAPSSASINIKQELIHVKSTEKYDALTEALIAREGSVIVFVKTKYGAERMAKKLSKDGHSTDALHGGLRQNKRERVTKAFRNQKYRILVATDVAARGLDISHIEHVINYDLPQQAEDYIHRIGRTGRAGNKGEALNLITPADKGMWRDIENLLNPSKSYGKSEKGSGSQPPRRKKKAKGYKAESGQSQSRSKLNKSPKRKEARKADGRGKPRVKRSQHQRAQA